MPDLILATRNKGKKRELVALMKGLPFDIQYLDDMNGAPEIIEDGKTFKENAIKKAVAIAKWSGQLSLGEDSGIQVDALQGAPGIYSARFAGEKATDRANNKKILKMLEGVQEDRRGASYRCAIAIATPKGVVGTVEGTCEGRITLQERGSNGFGYDPLFLRLDYNKTFGELDSGIKNRISHRARALEKAKLLLEKHLSQSQHTL